MGTKVKRCYNCGAINPPEEVLCAKCQVMLPLKPTESETLPPPRLELPAEAFKPTKPEFRKWPYKAVPVEFPPEPQRITVVDFDISFGNMVWLMVKAAFAAIPALIIITIFVVFIIAVLGGLGAGLHRS